MRFFRSKAVVDPVEAVDERMCQRESVNELELLDQQSDLGLHGARPMQVRWKSITFRLSKVASSTSTKRIEDAPFKLHVCIYAARRDLKVVLVSLEEVVLLE